MKRIPLKTVDVSLPSGSEMSLDYKTQLQVILRAPIDPKAGIDIEEMRGSIRVLDALDKADGDFCDLEDADFFFMVKKVNSAHFAQAHPAILQFVDDVTGA